MPTIRWIGNALYIASLVLTGAFVVLTVAKEASWPDAAFWASPPFWVSILRVLGVLAAASVPIQLWLARRRLGTSRARQRLADYSRLMFHEFVEGRRDMYPALGVHVWRIRAPWRGDPFLERVVTFRLAHRDQSRVVWTKGKGVIGECWSSGEEKVADIRPLKAAYDAGEDVFEALPAGDRNNLSYDEFRQVRHYMAIYARPLFAGRKLIGCVSVDCTLSDSYDHLETRRSVDSVAETAGLMGSALAGGG